MCIKVQSSLTKLVRICLNELTTFFNRLKQTWKLNTTFFVFFQHKLQFKYIVINDIKGTHNSSNTL